MLPFFVNSICDKLERFYVKIDLPVFQIKRHYGTQWILSHANNKPFFLV